jgi:integrase
MENAHRKLGKYQRVADRLYRYSVSKKYYAVFKFHGKTKWIPLNTTDRELAARRLKEEVEKFKKTDATASLMTLESLLNLYEQSIQGLAKHTQATRKSILSQFKKTWKHGLVMQVKAVTKGQVQLWLSEQRGRLKSSSLNEYIRFTRHLFAVALDHKVIGDSPAREFKLVRVEKPIRTTPSFEEFIQIVESIRSQKFNADSADSANLVEFMGKAGVGTAECANLRGENVDLAGGKITLYRQKTDTGYSIPIFPQLRPLVERLAAEGKIVDGQPVFRVKDPKKSLDAACKRLGIMHYSSRALRRCFITRAIELGVDFKTIAGWQGHQDGGVLIAKTYSHLRNEHSDNMAKKLVL